MAREAEEREAQAERLKALRAQARVSQVTAANEIGVTPRAYQAWEAGGDMSPENRKKAATYFGTTADYIEFGVMERRRRNTPDLARNGNAHDPERLAAIETELGEIRERLDELLRYRREAEEQLRNFDVETARDLLNFIQETRARQGREVGKRELQSRRATGR